MSPLDHERVSGLFLAARALRDAERAAFLDRRCEGDEALRREVEELLSHDETDDEFLEKSAIDPSAFSSRIVPDQIGDYRIIRMLGEGGMGVVYLAEQSRPRRRVALKVMLSAWASPGMLKRFEHEAQVLARLQHPGIAQIFEAAVADAPGGPQPYFAMEYVEGTSITAYAQARSLSVRDRLALMMRVCDAVQHAHQNGVIHRDLKPANILVSDAESSRTADGRNGRDRPASSMIASSLCAAPKVLDFGIARVTDPDGAQTMQLTQANELVGTLPYMSPEQFGGDPSEVDTRSDIYSLGLILYELFAERPAHDLARCGLSDAAREVRETEPASLGSINRAYRGDIENIAAKAMDKERQRRYQSAGEMAADIQRFLDNQPIIARSASRLYQLRKFVRRNRGIVAALGVAMLALSAGLVTTTWQAVRAQRAAARAESVNRFMRQMFAAIDPHVHGQEVRVLDIVKRAESEIEPTFGTEPLLEAEVRDEVAAIYVRLGALADAETHYVRALEIRRSELGVAHPDVLASLSHLGMLHAKQVRYDEAEPMLRDAYQGQRTVLGPDHADTLATMTDLATTLHAMGQMKEAEALCRAVLDVHSRRHGDEHLDTLTTTANLASVLQSSGASAEAEKLHHRAADGLARLLGPNHPTTLLSVANLARLLKEQKRYVEAEPLQRRVVDGLRERLGPQHPDALIASSNLAVMLWRQDKLDEAATLFRAVRSDFAAVYGDEHRHVVTVTIQLALALEKQSELVEAAKLLEAAVKGTMKSYGAEHPRTKQVIGHLERVRKRMRDDAA